MLLLRERWHARGCELKQPGVSIERSLAGRLELKVLRGNAIAVSKIGNDNDIRHGQLNVIM